MKKLEDRLSRMLWSEGIEEGVCGAVARLGARRVRQDTLIVIDPTDIRKRYAETVRRETEDGVKHFELQFGVMTAALPQRPDKVLRMVVVRGFGENPTILLTTLAETASRKALWQVVEGYLTRWRVEDAIRFVKQSYNLEDIRVLKYRRLKNMVALLLAVIYFNCVWLAGRLRCEILASNITHAAKRIYGIAEFLYYAVADGIGRLFTRHGKWTRYTPPEPESNPLGLVFLE